MTEKTKNLCAQIPESLHNKVRCEQQASGMPLNKYITQLLIAYYEREEKPTMTNKKTIAFTVPEEVFNDFKTYLDKYKLKQGLFLLNYIKRVLEEDAQAKPE